MNALHADYLNNILKRIIKYKLKPISPHGFRHTHALLLLDRGRLTQPSYLLNVWGMQVVQMTLGIYTHTTKTGEQKAPSKNLRTISIKAK